jgi:hypothetical protein
MAKTKHESLSQNSGGVSGPVAPEHVRRKVARQSKFMSREFHHAPKLRADTIAAALFETNYIRLPLSACLRRHH